MLDVRSSDGAFSRQSSAVELRSLICEAPFEVPRYAVTALDGTDALLQRNNSFVTSRKISGAFRAGGAGT